VTPLGTQSLQLESSTLSSYYRHSTSALIAQLTDSPLPYKLVSRPLAICRVQKSSIPQSHSKIVELGTYDHTASRTVPSSRFLDNYYCRRTRHMADSYPIFFCTTKHKPLAYPKNLIYSLDLTISLRMISLNEAQLGIQGFMQPLPEI
jgi:hypothetical protein